MENKTFKEFKTQPESVNESERSVIIYASTNQIDRYGDIIEPTAFEIEKIPGLPILLNHSSNQSVGKALWGRVTDIGLLLKIYISDKTQLAKDTWELVKEGIIAFASVGFIPLEWERILDDKNEPTGGYRFKKVDLIETSLTPTPANPGAIALALKTVQDSEMIKLIKSLEDKALHDAEMKTLKDKVLSIESEIKVLKELAEKNNPTSFKELNSKTSKELYELKKTVYEKLKEVSESLINLDKRIDYKEMVKVINNAVDMAVKNYLGKVS